MNTKITMPTITPIIAGLVRAPFIPAGAYDSLPIVYCRECPTLT